MQSWFGGSFRAVLDVARMADEIGIDQLCIAEHLVMSEEGIKDYPYGPYYQAIDAPWPEPIAYLGALAAVTSRIGLSTGVLLAPLRPAVLVAKQLATLDHLSEGRLTVGLGAGWQRAEYEACGVPFEGRFGRLAEQIGAMRALWSPGPASFVGETTRFEKVFAQPKPHGGRMIPIWLGLGLGPRNLDRIVALADGWLPVATDVDTIVAEASVIRAYCERHGRHPDTLAIRASPQSGTEPVAGSDFGQLQADCARLMAAGVETIQVYPHRLCKGPDEVARLFETLVGMRGGI